MTNPFEQWREAYPEAAAALAAIRFPSDGPTGQSEKAVEHEIMLDAARNGHYLTKNNKGALKDSTGRWVRFGLANSSKQESDTFASADLIGIYQVTVTPDMIGQVIGQFYSVEVKKPGKGRITQAQRQWAALVTAKGGRAEIRDHV